MTEQNPKAEKEKASAQEDRLAHKKKKKPLIVYILLGILGLLLLLAGVAAVLWWIGSRSLRSNTTGADMDMELEEVDSSVDETGLVHYNGKKYRYNDSIITGLVMGIDNYGDGKIPEATDTYAQASRADTIMLISLDTANRRITIIPISRDTITGLEAYDKDGNYIGIQENHLCLGYTYGPGGKESCEIMVRDVSSLMRGLPIQYYTVITTYTLGQAAEAVGGVTVTVTDDTFDYPPYNWKNGQQVTVSGDSAIAFIRSRGDCGDGSNNQRMERQKQFLREFLAQAKTAIRQNPSLVLNLYNDLAGYYLTDLNAAQATYFASQLLQSGYEIQYVTLPGENKYQYLYDSEGSHDAFYPDETALYETILDVYYDEVTEG